MLALAPKRGKVPEAHASRAKSPSTARHRERRFRRRTGDRRVLLTGASGFVGREVLRQLLDEGWQVVTVSRKRPSGLVPPGVIHVTGDVNGDAWLPWGQGVYGGGAPGGDHP